MAAFRWRMLLRILPFSLCLAPAGCRHSEVLTVSGPSGMHRVPEGSVESTENPQVVRYTVASEEPASVTVFFWHDSESKLQTWTKPATGDSEPLTLLVAGMRPDTDYHLRAELKFGDGSVIEDREHLFHTGSLPSGVASMRIHAQDAAPGMQPGVELLDSSVGQQAQGVVTDFEGRILWHYEMPDAQSQHRMHFLRQVQGLRDRVYRFFHHAPHPDALTVEARRTADEPELAVLKNLADFQIVNPIQQLPNGDFALVYGLPSQTLLAGPMPAGAVSGVREIDLSGHVVREITISELNEKLRAAGHGEMELQMFHHNVEVLPNGHWLVLANGFRPGTHPQQGETDVFGDEIVELDCTLSPVWVWSSFDHLDLKHHPLLWPDWTHANAVVYTPDDGNLLVSMRDQSWVLKIDYRNGRGTGKVLWRLGAGGDFKLIGGRDPQDWNYAQHFPSIVGPRSAGRFDLTMMDNGNGRPDDHGTSCVEPTEKRAGTPCYSTVPVFEIDEQARTATIVARKVFPPRQFSTWGGNADQLPNGNFEVTLSSQPDAKGKYLVSNVYELSAAPVFHPIWQLTTQLPKQVGSLYRAHRLQSLYPGVTWPDPAMLHEVESGAGKGAETGAAR
ncbi:aryl-sulfate sulfotransferase [Silvibacterium sp.]|uniref:aryl-sulfate sulfotransferase n=1 Tax=Silvibacterium sp. TaxID=1964179 RepID=UPI0039E5D8C4